MVEIRSVEKNWGANNFVTYNWATLSFLLRVFFRFYSIFTQKLTVEYNLTTKKNCGKRTFSVYKKKLINSNCVFYWVFAWKCVKTLNTSCITFCLFIFFIANSNLFFSLFAPSIAVTIDLNSLKNPKFEKNSLSSVPVSVQTNSRSMIGSQLEVACLSYVSMNRTFQALWVH